MKKLTIILLTLLLVSCQPEETIEIIHECPEKYMCRYSISFGLDPFGDINVKYNTGSGEITDSGSQYHLDLETNTFPMYSGDTVYLKFDLQYSSFINGSMGTASGKIYVDELCVDSLHFYKLIGMGSPDVDTNISIVYILP